MVGLVTVVQRSRVGPEVPARHPRRDVQEALCQSLQARDVHLQDRCRISNIGRSLKLWEMRS